MCISGFRVRLMAKRLYTIVYVAHGITYVRCCRFVPGYFLTSSRSVVDAVTPCELSKAISLDSASAAANASTDGVSDEASDEAIKAV